MAILDDAEEKAVQAHLLAAGLDDNAAIAAKSEASAAAAAAALKAGLGNGNDSGVKSSHEAAFLRAAGAAGILLGVLPEEAAAASAAETAAAMQSLRNRAHLAAARLAANAERAAARARAAAAVTAARGEASRAAVHSIFAIAESRLRFRIAALGTAVAARFGTLAPSRELRISWAYIPRPIEVRVLRLRGVRERLPAGRYVLTVALHAELGGTALRWGRACAPAGGVPGAIMRPGITTPTKHGGSAADADLTFDQCVYALAPGAADARPCQALVFELLSLDSTRCDNGAYAVAGWAALPAADADAALPRGRFRLPVLRGMPSSTLSRYSAIEAELRNGVGSGVWLGNLYLELSPLAGEAFLGGAAARDHDAALAIADAALALYGADGLPRAPVPIGRQCSDDARDADAVAAAVDGESPPAKDQKNLPLQRRSLSEGLADASAGATSGTSPHCGSSTCWHTPESIEEADAWVGDPPIVRATEIGLRARPGSPARVADSALTASQDQVGLTSASSPPDAWSAPFPLQEEGSTLIASREAEFWQSFTYSMRKCSLTGSSGDRSSAQSLRKLRFLRRELLCGGGGCSSGRCCTPGSLLALFASADTWLHTALASAALWLRMLAHYGAQALLLTALGAPVVTFVPGALVVVLAYPAAALPPAVELSIVAVGPIGAAAAFALLIVAVAAAQAAMGAGADALSYFTAYFGVAAALDALLVLLADAAQGRLLCSSTGASAPCRAVSGDALKLYVRLGASDGASAALGAGLTIAIYTATTLASTVLLYSFLLHVHLRSRLVDLFHRLHESEAHCVDLMPRDDEVSPAELAAAIASARRWRGPCGETRTVVITEEMALRSGAGGHNDDVIAQVSIFDPPTSASAAPHRQGALQERMQGPVTPVATQGADEIKIHPVRGHVPARRFLLLRRGAILELFDPAAAPQL